MLTLELQYHTVYYCIIVTFHDIVLLLRIFSTFLFSYIFILVKTLHTLPSGMLMGEAEGGLMRDSSFLIHHRNKCD